MRIAFYAPRKPMDDPTPSGDRRLARLFFDVLKAAGHEPFVASSLMTHEPTGDRTRQADLRRRGAAIASHLIAGYRTGELAPPEMWFTYRLGHEAPDWIGPTVAAALRIPYVVAEASLDPKRARGPWAVGYDGALEAARAADLLLALSETDKAGLKAVLDDAAPIRRLARFIETPGVVNARSKSAARATLARIYPGLNPAMLWLLSVAMMREGDKATGYDALSRALKSHADRYAHQTWQLVVAGDGPARGDVEAGFWDLPGGRVALLGVADRGLLELCYLAADIYTWPGAGKTHGMAYLETAAAGLPIVACDYPVAREFIRDGETGLLVPPGDPHAFADAIGALLADPVRRAAMGAKAQAAMRERHSFADAVETLRAVLPTARRGATVGMPGDMPEAVP